MQNTEHMDRLKVIRCDSRREMGEQAALDALNAPADEESLNEDSTEISDSEYISSENISSEISEE